MERTLHLNDDDVELVRDAHRVLAELAEIRPDDLTLLFYLMQYDNLTIVIRDLLHVLRVGPDEPWPEDSAPHTDPYPGPDPKAARP